MDAHPFKYPDANQYGDIYTDADEYPDVHGHLYADANVHADIHTYFYANVELNAHGHVYAKYHADAARTRRNDCNDVCARRYRHRRDVNSFGAKKIVGRGSLLSVAVATDGHCFGALLSFK